MTNEQLKRANEIKKELAQLDHFIFYAERCWTGRLIHNLKKMFFKSDAHGSLKSSEYELNTDMKNKVLAVIKQRADELKSELESI